MDRIEAAADRIDQRVEDLGRHRVRMQGRLQRAGIPARARVEDVVLHVRVEIGGHRVLHRTVGVQEGLEGLLPDAPVRRLDELVVTGLGQFDAVAVGVGHLAIAQVGVVQGVEDGAGAAGHQAGRRQQRFLFGGQRVLASALYVLDEVLEDGQALFLGQHFGQPVRRDLQQLGFEPAGGLGVLDAQTGDAALARRVLTDASVLVALHAGEDHGLLQLAAHGVDRLDRTQERRTRSRQGSLQLRQRRQRGLDFGEGLLPALPVGEDLLQLPLEAVLDLAALGQRATGPVRGPVFPPPHRFRPSRESIHHRVMPFLFRRRPGYRLIGFSAQHAPLAHRARVQQQEDRHDVDHDREHHAARSHERGALAQAEAVEPR